MDIIGIIMQVAVSVGMALALGLWIYLRKWQKGEKYNFFKLLTTLVSGIVLGVVAGFTNYDLTVENWGTYLAANAGAIAFADQGFKMLFNLLGIKLPDGV